MNLNPMIGLEIHVQLMSQTKMYCRCSCSYSDPNTNCCPVCYGLPGALPVPNKYVFDLASRCAHLLKCSLNEFSVAERKNYFYPDLPKGYQISQFLKPIGENGEWFFFSEGVECKARIRRIQVEEDTAQLIVKGQDSLLDFNRSGIPLLEIVTEPDFKNSREAGEFLRSLRSSLIECEISTGKMETGAMRCEPNVSVSVDGRVSNKVEIKNLGSISGVEKAIKWEIACQVKQVEDGEVVNSVTKGWDESSQKCILQRVKESASDYRYFPDPDLSMIKTRKSSFDVLTPYQKVKIMMDKGVSFQMARTISLNHKVFNYYQSFPKGINNKELAAWITGPLSSFWKNDSSVLGISPKVKDMTELICYVESGKVTRAIAKEILPKLIKGSDIDSLINALGDSNYLSDQDLSVLAEDIVRQNPGIVEKYLNGKTAVIKSLVGMGMRKSKGRAHPELLKLEIEKNIKLT
ncbi:Asp-tRNA(Asn)/Glu-tRNA(Gln) amidotransferase GatCAB subunit B [bacterium]|nr:Asp-tRNA(Asn)/Glu-tRNA(Gln) amidotransferase GatCAB subunit B [bacterium]|tara:strand:- start:8054 stop:9442 length:1389 start_codon:yes stop_codon:yes gene_type:complete